MNLKKKCKISFY